MWNWKWINGLRVERNIYAGTKISLELELAANPYSSITAKG
jgi:hypothetical protein